MLRRSPKRGHRRVGWEDWETGWPHRPSGGWPRPFAVLAGRH